MSSKYNTKSMREKRERGRGRREREEQRELVDEVWEVHALDWQDPRNRLPGTA